MREQVIDFGVRHMARGMSTQPEHLRLPGQLEAAENITLSVRTGMMRRPPTQYLREIAGLASAEAVQIHPIERDAAERYIIVVADDNPDTDLLALDGANGWAPATVNIDAASQTYLNAGNANGGDFRFLTVADTTYVCNTKVALGSQGTANYTVSATFNTYQEMIASSSLAIGQYARVLDASGDPEVTEGEAFYRFRGSPASDGTTPVLKGPALGLDWNSPTDVYDNTSRGRICGGISVVIARTSLAPKVTTDLTYDFSTGTLTAGGSDTPFAIGSDWGDLRDSAGNADIWIEITQGTGMVVSNGADPDDCEVRPIKGGSYIGKDGWYRFKRISDTQIQLDNANDPDLSSLLANVTDVRIGRVAQKFGGRISTLGPRTSMSAIALDWLDNEQHDGQTTGFRDAQPTAQVNTSVASPGYSVGDDNFVLAYETGGGAGYFTITAPFAGASVEFLWVDAPPYETIPTSYGGKNASFADGVVYDAAGTQVFPPPPSSPHPFEMNAATGSPSAGIGTGTDSEPATPGDRWERVDAPGSAGSQPDSSTMPQVLIRVGLGPTVFDLDPATWDARTSGDSTTNPLPEPFQEQLTIRDQFLFRNRYGFVAGPYITLSQDGDLFNFFRDSGTEEIDSDPLTTLPSSRSVNHFLRVSAQRDALVFFTPNQQFELSVSGALTPSSFSIDRSTRSPFADAEPAELLSFLYFAAESNTDGVLYEYFFDDASVASVAQDVSKHIEGALPSGITRVASCPLTNMIFAAVRGSSTIYVYHAWWSGTEKEQSAWAEWTIAGTVEDLAVIGPDLFIAQRMDDGACVLTRMELQGEADTIAGAVNRVLYIDNRVLVDAADITLNGSDSDIDLASAAPGTTAADFDVAVPASGTDAGVPIDASAGTSASVLRITNKDYSGTPVWIGKRYTSRAALTRPFIFDQQGRPDLNYDLDVRYLLVRHEEASAYSVRVEDAWGRDQSFPFTPGASAFSREDDGTHEVWVSSDAEQTDITLTASGVYGVSWTGLQWRVVPADRLR